MKAMKYPEKSQLVQAPRLVTADKNLCHAEEFHGPFPDDSVASPTEKPPLPSDENDDGFFEMIRQPETRSISRDQLAVEVAGIYAGLVLIEIKCIEVDNAQSSNTHANSKLNNKQCEALNELHIELLRQHYDFFLASQHPNSSPALRELASKYAMPARLWRHGIHSFLELLLHRLPVSLEHMLTFLDVAYNIMGLLYETVPAFKDTWIECLGDIARYRMAIEDYHTRDRKVWTDASRYWYSKASDISPKEGRLYHHLAILSKPNAVQQVFYYTKSLLVPKPFLSTRETIMTIFEPLLSNGADTSNGIDASFVRVHSILFTGTHWDQLQDAMNDFNDDLDKHIIKSNETWKEEGYHIAISLTCSLLGYGVERNALTRAISTELPETDVAMDGSTILQTMPDEKFSQAYEFGVTTIETVLCRQGDVNTLPFLHTIFVFIHYMTQHPTAISHLEDKFPWKLTAAMLNSLLESCEPRYKVQSHKTLLDNDRLTRPLPEDFAMRGLLYSEDYYSEEWFHFDTVDIDERYVEQASMAEERRGRILSLGRSIATSGRWLVWDQAADRFSPAVRYETEEE